MVFRLEDDFPLQTGRGFSGSMWVSDWVYLGQHCQRQNCQLLSARLGMVLLVAPTRVACVQKSMKRVIT